ncbi:hypothetical protein HK101_006185, partial [Irineochytrium annulatum]
KFIQGHTAQLGVESIDGGTKKQPITEEALGKQYLVPLISGDEFVESAMIQLPGKVSLTENIV